MTTRIRISAVVAAALTLAFVAGTVGLAASGDLDRSFSADGKVTTPIASGPDAASALGVQADGKILVAGFAFAPGLDFALARYHPDGSLDASFSGDGKLTTAVGSGAQGSQANALGIQTDGKIVVAGRTDQGAITGNDIALVRYNPNGSLDASFSGDGKETTAIASGTELDEARALGIQPDGKIVVAGTTCPPPKCVFALARYNPDGSLDTTFSDDGMQTTTIGAGANADAVSALRIQRDGKIVVAGTADQLLTGRDFALARYNPNGSLDTSFSGDGRLTTSLAPSSNQESAFALGVHGDGKLVAAGLADPGGATGTDIALARYNPNGSLDTSFSGDGRQSTAIAPGAGHDAAAALEIQADGRIVVAGNSTNSGDFALARYNANGSLDTSFSGDGKLTAAVAPGSGFDGASALAIQRDGSFLAAGEAWDPTSDFALIRVVGDRADLSLTGASQPQAVGRGKEATLNIVVANTGPEGGLARLGGRLPNGLDFVSGDGCGESGGVIRCELGLIRADATGGTALRVRVGAKARGPLETAVGVFGPTFDPDRSRNVKTITTFLKGACRNYQTGTNGRDKLVGTPYGDKLKGKRGRDRLSGQGGRDCLSGGSGRDRLSGGSGGDRIKAGKGNDRVSGGSGRDRINVRGGGKDRVRCGKGKDRVKADRSDHVSGCERVSVR